MRALLVHGFADNADSWDATIRALESSSVECFAPVFPWSNLNKCTWLADTPSHAHVTRTLDTVRPDLVIAHSYGTLATLESLSRTPPRKNLAAVLVSPVIASSTENTGWSLLDRTRIEFNDLIRNSILGRAAKYGRTLSADSLDGITEKMLSEISPIAFTELFQKFVLARHLAPLPEQVVGRIITSKNDPGIAGRRAIDLSEQLGWVLHQLDGSDHFLQISKPETIAQEAFDALQQLEEQL